jgi:hypothetical protein
LLALLVAASAWVAPLAGRAQEDPSTSPVCVLTADEMTALVGVPIAEVDAAGLECAYSADPAQRLVQVIVSIIPADPTASAPNPDGLFLLRFDHPDGQDATLAGLPAWVATDGTWVDIGDDVLAVWLNAVFDADPPAMPATAHAIAEAVLPRYLAAPRPSPTPRSAAGGIAARFPESLDGEPLDLEVVTGPVLFDQLAMFAFGDAAQGLADLQAAIEAMGLALDDVEGGFATTFDFEAGVSLSMIGIQVPGGDAATLLDPAQATFVDFAGATPETLTLAGREVIHVAEPPGGLDGHRWFLADGDVLWMLDGDQVLVEVFLAALPPAGGGS